MEFAVVEKKEEKKYEVVAEFKGQDDWVIASATKADNGELTLHRLPPGIKIGDKWNFWRGSSASELTKIRDISYSDALEIMSKPESSYDQVIKGITDLCETDILKLVKKITGVSKVTLDNYNFYCRNKDIIQMIASSGQENILVAYILCDEPESITSAKEVVSAIKGDLNKNQWNTFLQLNLPTIRQAIHNNGVNSADLREVCRMVDASELPIQVITKGKLRMLCDLVQGYSQGYVNEDRRATARALAKVMLKSGRQESYIKTVVSSVNDFLRETEVTPQQVERWGLDGCARRSREWHENIALNRGNFRQNYPKGETWDLGIERQEIDGYVIIPLQTSDELGMEGAIMQHCVGGYWNRCKEGTSSIFSIRNEAGERVGTLELTKFNNQTEWRKNNLLAARNRPVTPGVRAAAEQFIEYYNENNTRGKKKE